MLKKLTESYRTIDLAAFEPEATNLMPLNELLAIADLPLDQIPDIGAELGWLWSPENMNGTSSGWNQTEGVIQDQIDQTYTSGSSDLAEATEELVEENRDPSWWERATAYTIVTSLYILFLLGIGGLSNVMQGDEIYARDRARRQLMYLREFANQVVDGNLSAAQIRARIQYYINEARIRYEESLRRAYQKEGWNWEKSVLSQAENCPGCVLAESQGWVPIGTLVPKGERDCLFNCKCSWSYSRSIERPADSVRLLSIKTGWVK